MNDRASNDVAQNDVARNRKASTALPWLRIGIDLGGTKIAAIAFDRDERVVFETRVPTPRHDYEGVIAAIAALVREAEQAGGASAGEASVGIGTPGSVSPATGRMQNANSTWLNDRPFREDLERALGRAIRMENDANCLALSEAHDGAAKGARGVFGVILGTGVGGGLIFDGRVITGHNAIGGEWGHNPLPWPKFGEMPGPACWCGRRGCIETFLSGPALEAEHLRITRRPLKAADIAAGAAAGDKECTATLQRHADRLARALAHVVNIFDPEVIVLGGGLSNIMQLYEVLPGLMRPWIFAAEPRIDIRAPKHGDASGVRGAARLWP